MHQSIMDFADRMLDKEVVADKRILEVGSYDLNGSLRPQIELLQPSEYVGVDIISGPGVDIVCSAAKIARRFGRNSFDIVFTTEMLEHVRNWRAAIMALKSVVRPGGLLLVTTRSFGFPMHEYPYDMWRFEVEDFQRIFSDMNVISLERDPFAPGVFMLAKKPENFREAPLADICLFSMLVNKRKRNVSYAFHCFSMKMAELAAKADPFVPKSFRILIPKSFKEKIWGKLK